MFNKHGQPASWTESVTPPTRDITGRVMPCPRPQPRSIVTKIGIPCQSGSTRETWSHTGRIGIGEISRSDLFETESVQSTESEYCILPSGFVTETTGTHFGDKYDITSPLKRMWILATSEDPEIKDNARKLKGGDVAATPLSLRTSWWSTLCNPNLAMGTKGARSGDSDDTISRLNRISIHTSAEDQKNKPQGRKETETTNARKLHLKLLRTVSQGLNNEEFKRLRADCYWIDRAVVDEIETPRDLLDQLDEQGIIGMGNYSELMELLENHRLIKLKREVEKLANEMERILGEKSGTDEDVTPWTLGARSKYTRCTPYSVRETTGAQLDHRDDILSRLLNKMPFQPISGYPKMKHHESKETGEKSVTDEDVTPWTLGARSKYTRCTPYSVTETTGAQLDHRDDIPSRLVNKMPFQPITGYPKMKHHERKETGEKSVTDEDVTPRTLGARSKSTRCTPYSATETTGAQLDHRDDIPSRLVNKMPFQPITGYPKIKHHERKETGEKSMTDEDVTPWTLGARSKYTRCTPYLVTETTGAQLDHRDDIPSRLVNKMPFQPSTGYPKMKHHERKETGTLGQPKELHQQLLLVVAENLEIRDFERLKGLCKCWVTPATLEEIKNTQKLLEQLEKQAIIQVGEYSKLIDLLGRLDLIALKHDVERMSRDINALGVELTGTEANI